MTSPLDIGEGVVDPAGELEAGFMLDGKYRIETLVGSGGMGFIYRATNEQTGEEVAVKVLRDVMRHNPSAVRRFKREAETVSVLFHPNTITLHDYGVDTDGFSYLVMEWLDGIDLADHLEAVGQMDPASACAVGLQVARALQEAHAKRIIHRDLKPENVFLIQDKETGKLVIKVLDFGIAKIIEGPLATQITRIGMICGTPDFMSPEQARGEDLDGRSDVYALGCLLFTVLRGDVPFPAPTPVRVVMRHQLEEFPRLPEEVPEALADIVYKATEKDRGARFASAEEMADALDACLEELGEPAIERLALAAISDGLSSVSEAVTEPTIVDAMASDFSGVRRPPTAPDYSDEDGPTKIGVPAFEDDDEEGSSPDEGSPAVVEVAGLSRAGVGGEAAVGGGDASARPAGRHLREPTAIVPAAPTLTRMQAYQPTPPTSSGGAGGRVLLLAVLCLFAIAVGVAVTVLFFGGGAEPPATRDKASESTPAAASWLTFRTDPVSALVSNRAGEELGETPLTLYDFEPGEAPFTVRADGFASQDVTLPKLEEGENIIDVILVPDDAVQCQIASRPSGARILNSEGMVLGRTPGKVWVPRGLFRELDIVLDGYAPATVRVQDGGDCARVVELARP